jgi:pyruvate formate lyase activating enzyme
MTIDRFPGIIPAASAGRAPAESSVLSRRLFLAASAGFCAACALGRGVSLGAPAAFPPYPAGPKEARYYEKLGNKVARCAVCPRKCVILDGERGFCSTRENRGGTLYSLVYGRVASMAVDPIEKKPLFHFLPGSQAYSIATAGCNFTCKFCQNYAISQAKPEELRTQFMSPETVASEAKASGAQSIAFTYNEPTVFTEFARDCAAAGERIGVRSVVISNGFISPEPLESLAEVIAAYKVDFKAFSKSFYREVAGGDREPVLATIKLLRKLNVWTELVHLTIPTLNDGENDLRGMGDWLMGEVGPDVPVHFTRFYPLYRLTNLPVTPVSTLEKAREILMAKGMRYVYVGNIPGHPGESTYCPKCGKIVIERGYGYSVKQVRMNRGACGSCGTPIPGVWS